MRTLIQTLFLFAIPFISVSATPIELLNTTASLKHNRGKNERRDLTWLIKDRELRRPIERALALPPDADDDDGLRLKAMLDMEDSLFAHVETEGISNDELPRVDDLYNVWLVLYTAWVSKPKMKQLEERMHDWISVFQACRRPKGSKPMYHVERYTISRFLLLILLQSQSPLGGGPQPPVSLTPDQERLKNRLLHVAVKNIDKAFRIWESECDAGRRPEQMRQIMIRSKRTILAIVKRDIPHIWKDVFEPQ